MPQSLGGSELNSHSSVTRILNLQNSGTTQHLAVGLMLQASEMFFHILVGYTVSSYPEELWRGINSKVRAQDDVHSNVRVEIDWEIVLVRSQHILKLLVPVRQDRTFH